MNPFIRKLRWYWPRRTRFLYQRLEIVRRIDDEGESRVAIAKEFNWTRGYLKNKLYDGRRDMVMMMDDPYALEALQSILKEDSNFENPAFDLTWFYR